MNEKVRCVDIDGKWHEVGVDQLTWRPSAYGILIKDNALLVSPQFNGYDLPGGGIELGETPDEAVIREVEEEETGIIAGNPRLLICHTNFFKLPRKTNPYVESFLLYYACDVVGGELSDKGFTEDEKVNSQFPEWIPLDNFDIKLSEGRLASSYDWRPLVKQVAVQS